MAKRDRNQRANAGETGENSGNTVVRNTTVDHEEVQNEANENVAAAAGNAANVAAAPVGLEAVLMLLAQVLERLPAVAPVPAVPPQVVPPQVVEEPAVVVVDPVVRIPSYLKVMDHMLKLGTKYFSGGYDPIEADEWRTRLERNFESIRCPDEYKKDIAVHYLESDAHIWWKGVEGRLDNPRCSWETFSALFKTKYFPPEAYDRLEGAFLDLHQGTKTVREYETEFNQLKKYAGRELENELVQVRRFMRGMRLDLKNGCCVRNYSTVAELVEKASILEAGFAEEKVLRGGASQTATRQQGQNNAGQNKKKWEKNVSMEKSPARRSVCMTCGKMHVGECRTASGACHRCGSMTHKVRDCPEEDLRMKNPGKNGVARVCYNCNEPGHFKRDCPKLEMAQQVAGQLKRRNDGLPPPAKRQEVMPRLYNATMEGNTDPSTSRSITGESYHLAFN